MQTGHRVEFAEMNSNEKAAQVSGWSWIMIYVDLYVDLYRFWLDSSLLGTCAYTRYMYICNNDFVT